MKQERINEEYGFDHPSFGDPGRPVLSVPDEVLEKIIEDKIREESKHGGARAGAGRPALPGEKRKPRTIWANEEEYEQVQAQHGSRRIVYCRR